MPVTTPYAFGPISPPDGFFDFLFSECDYRPASLAGTSAGGQRFLDLLFGEVRRSVRLRIWGVNEKVIFPNGTRSS